MGSDIPDIRLTVCVGEFPYSCTDVNKLGQGFPRMSGSFPRCWDGAGAMEAKQLLWFCSRLVRLVRGPFLVCRILYYFCLIRRPWFKQGFGQSAAGAKCGPTDLPEGGHECPLWSGEPTQWVTTSMFESPFNISLQSSTQWSQCWKTAVRHVRPWRSVPAAKVVIFTAVIGVWIFA